jgi:ATP-dependent DNA ligase
MQKGQPTVYTRAGLDWTLRFQPIADALVALSAQDLILDGEVVVADSRGIPDFGLLHAALAAGRQDRLLYYALDLLYLDSFDLRGAPLAERKRMLLELLAGASERILYATTTSPRSIRRASGWTGVCRGPRSFSAPAAGARSCSPPSPRHLCRSGSGRNLARAADPHR